MTLRRQLLLVSLLLLSLPWAGCQFIREMEGAMRQGQHNALQATARAIATVARTRAGDIFSAPTPAADTISAGRSLYAFPAKGPVIVDGYDDGWEDVRGATFKSDDNGHPDLSVRARARNRDGRLYLLLEVEDNEVKYYNPGLEQRFNGDRLLLRLGADREPRDYVIVTAAPGEVRAHAASRSARSDEAAGIHGYWQDVDAGYSLELEMPLTLTGGHLGFAVISDDGAAIRHAGNITPDTQSPAPRLVSSTAAAHELVIPFAEPGRQILLLDREGWVLSNESSPAVTSDQTEKTFWLLQLLYRSILAQDELVTPPRSAQAGKLGGAEIQAALAGTASGQRYRDPAHSARTLLSSAVPVLNKEQVVGVVVVRESGETYLSLTDQAFSRLLGYSLIAMGAAALGLLGYASVLSWRIRRLSRAVDSAITEDGAITDDFRGSRARDEVGDLSRHYAALLRRVREYNDYLRTLSRKLSHELRTPIAVIQSSLDNLEQTGASTNRGTDQDAEYRARAREGLTRLQRILTAMSEATRLEESIRADTLAPKDLVPMLGSVWNAYRDLHTCHDFSADLPSSATADVAPELLIQAVDKIVDNAVSFCPEGGAIQLTLSEQAGSWTIHVSNDGPTLPEDNLGQLFDPMVSLREGGSEGVHLGLGLHIVRLVSDFHHGRVYAANRPDGSGVIVSLELPKAG